MPSLYDSSPTRPATKQRRERRRLRPAERLALVLRVIFRHFRLLQGFRIAWMEFLRRTGQDNRTLRAFIVFSDIHCQQTTRSIKAKIGGNIGSRKD
jgi:hypothetical protein